MHYPVDQSAYTDQCALRSQLPGQPYQDAVQGVVFTNASPWIRLLDSGNDEGDFAVPLTHCKCI
jgi:hypothetical protein